jgi:hypothetical protein
MFDDGIVVPAARCTVPGLSLHTLLSHVVMKGALSTAEPPEMAHGQA